jgi:hypothetical protein
MVSVERRRVRVARERGCGVEAASEAAACGLVQVREWADSELLRLRALVERKRRSSSPMIRPTV